MPEERLGGDERHGRDVVEARLLDPVADVEQKLVGGAEARAALRGADHHGPRVLEEPLPGIARQQRVLEVADRLRVAVVRPEPGTFSNARRGPVPMNSLSKVSCSPAAVRDGVPVEIDLGRRLVDEADPLAGVERREREGDVLGVADPERKPDQRRDEREVRTRVEHHDLVPIGHPLSQLQGGGHPRETRTQDHYSLAAGHHRLLTSTQL